MARMNRRKFLTSSTAVGGSLLLAQNASADAPRAARDLIDPVPQLDTSTHMLPDLAPAHWIWYPSGRTLPNTFILFRRSLHMVAKPRRCPPRGCCAGPRSSQLTPLSP